MKTILLKLCALCALVAGFVALLVLPVYLSDAGLPPSEGYWVRDLRKVYDGTGDAETIILGNSRALNSLSAPLLASLTGRSTVNLAIKAADICTSRLVLETYLKNCRALPKYCLLEVSWFSFNTARTSFNLNFATDLLLNDPAPLHYLYRHPELLQHLLIKGELDAAHRVRQLVTAGSWRVPPKGYVDYAVNLNLGKGTVPFVKKEMLRYFPNYQAGVDAELLGDLREMAALCRKKGVQLVLYSAPELPEYTQAQQDRAQVKRSIRAVAQETGSRYLDFTPDGPLWRPDFAAQLHDSHHLDNPDAFTRYFASTLWPPGAGR